MDLVVRGKRDAKPLLLKVGVALALSFAGFIVAQIRSRLKAPPHAPSTPKVSSSAGLQSVPGGNNSGGGGLKEELRILKTEESLAKIVNGTSSTTTTTTTTTTTVVGLSPTSRSSGDEEGFLLPEFNDLVMKEFEDTGKDLEATTSPTMKRLEVKEESLMEQEIANLRSLVMSLRERERCLEMQLLEYYGMQEQEAALRELESQLKINSVEAKLYSLKIESLQTDNKRLQAQLADYTRTKNELEEARAKVKLLKKKLRLDAEQAKEKMASLHQRISVLQCREQEDAKDEVEIERKLRRLKEMEDQAMELKIENLRLAEENRDLATKLENMQSFQSSVAPQAEELEEANYLLREANQKLTKDIEQLQTDRCADVEELVYLRWVNACLRYELRNYQPPPGKTVARDLSKNLSPKSEEKAKQLIFEYANSSANDKSISLGDLDSEYSSSSQASTVDPDDTSMDPPSSLKHGSSNKVKFLHKLKKLILGKESSSKKVSAIDRTPNSSVNSRRASVSTCSMDDVIGRDSYHSYSSTTTEELVRRMEGIEEADEQQQIRSSQSSAYSRPSLDIQRLKRLNLEKEREERAEPDGSDCGTPYRYKTTVSEEARLINLGDNRMLDSNGTDSPEIIELKKFAYALKSSRGNPKFNRRSASFSS